MKQTIAGILLICFLSLSLPLGVLAETANDVNNNATLPSSNAPENGQEAETIPGVPNGYNTTPAEGSVEPTLDLSGNTVNGEKVNQQKINSEAETIKTQNTGGQAGTGEKPGATPKGSINAAAEGIGGCVGSVVSSLIVTYVSSLLGVTQPTNTPVNNVAGNAKDASGIAGSGITWDQIGFCVANALIAYISQATINWIKGGFEGSPAFIDDPGQFFKDIGDQEAGAFIQELGGDFLCSEFRPRVQLAILQNSRKTSFAKKSQCSLTQIKDNVNSFKDDFNNGGWKEWIELTQVPQNNEAGALAMAEDELQGRITVSAGNRKQEIDWGRGYLPFKKCETDPTTGKKINCKTTTPGQMIETQVNQTLGLGKARLTIADEFDEVVTALVNELIKIALNETLGNN